MGVLAKGLCTKVLPLEEDDDDEEGDAKGTVLKVNQAYAERLAHNQKRAALHRLQELKKRGIVDSSDEEEDDDGDEESSDDGLLPARTDARIFDTLTKIKQKDPSIYSLESNFFDDNDEENESDQYTEKQVRSGSKSRKPVYLKDALATQLLEDGPSFDDDDFNTKKKHIVTYADEQLQYKNEFLRNAKLDDAEEDNDGVSGFLKLRRKEQPQALDDAAELISYDKDIAQKLDEYFGEDNDLDENGKFLKDYLLKKSWIDEDADRIPLYEDIVSEVIEDERELEMQDKFESEYNFRFEEGAGSQVLGHSRLVEDSVRRKDDTRKQKRGNKKARQSEAAFERREELKRLKNIKKKEILEKLKKIRTVAGVKELDPNLLQEEDLEEEFDPEEYDQKMCEAFGEEYYGAEDAEVNFRANDMDDFETPNFEEEDERFGLLNGWDEVTDRPASAMVGFSAARQKVKEMSLANLEPQERNLRGKDLDSNGSKFNKGIEDEQDSDVEAELGDGGPLPSISKRKKKAKISLREKLAFDKQLEEYYKLDYEDIVGDLPTRFKYRQVKPNMYNLSVSEILAAEDKDLNQFVSLKKLAPYVTQEWKPKWRFQVSQKMRKKKARKLKILTQTVDHTTGAPCAEGGAVKGISSSAVQNDEVEQIVSGTEGPKRKKKRRKKGLSLSESRLIAYGKISLPSRKRKRV